MFEGDCGTNVLDTNKENNANVHNITGNVPVSNFTLPVVTYTPELDKECINYSSSKVSMSLGTYDLQIWISIFSKSEYQKG